VTTQVGGIAMTVSEHHIREAVARYVSGEITRTEFQEWFAPRAWELLSKANSPAADLASHIELLFAEFSNADWTEAQLRENLADVADLPQGRLFRIESPLMISVTGGPLENTIVAHQTGSFWIDVTNPSEVQRAA
jgi:hypothetical protein